MTRSDIIRYAKLAGIDDQALLSDNEALVDRNVLYDFAEIVAFAERQACIQIVERNDNPETRLAADAIRARSYQ